MNVRVPSNAAADPTAVAYTSLVARLKRAHVISTVSGLLSWDEQVNLPTDSADLRADQSAVMAELSHGAASDPELETLLRALEAPAAARELTADQAVVVRLARRDYDRVTKLPAAFVAEVARHSSAAYHAWAQAKQADDFASYVPYIEKHLALAKQEAAYLGWADRPYDYAIDKHDPGMTAAQVDVLFTELKQGLLPLVRRILAKRRAVAELKGFPIDAQRAFLKEVTARLGFDYRRGRIDVSLHPFCSGSGADIRMTTRFQEDAPLDSLFSSIHETGHGLYEQGLPLADQGTPLGQAVGMGVHESQSRLWENQVSRGRAFWAYFEPLFRSTFPAQTAGLSSEDLYLAVNAVEPTLIRVDADEVTYNLHILLRFEIEQRLFRGELAVRDLPAAWNALSQELVGLTPPNQRTGVLQDVHWSGGAFGYFPSYCLGNMIAAQLWSTVRATFPDLEADFARGDFSRLLGWLRSQIHHRGRRLDTLALVKAVTGQPLSPRHLLRYLEERYLPLYS